MDKAEHVRRWEAQGIEATRLELHTADTWSEQTRSWAIAWLAEKDEARGKATIKRERKVATMATVAAVTAIVAAVIGLIDLIVSFLAWTHPRPPS